MGTRSEESQQQRRARLSGALWAGAAAAAARSRGDAAQQQGQGQGQGRDHFSAQIEGMVKATINPVESAKHQTGKALRKTVKLVRGFLVQRCSRSLAEIKEKSGEKSAALEDALEELKVLKGIDHGKVADAIFAAEFGTFSSANSKLPLDHLVAKVIEQVEGGLDAKICRQFVQHKKVLETVKLWRAKLEEASLIPVARSKRKLEKADKALKVQPRIGAKDRLTAVFVDSLQEDEDRAAEERQRRKEAQKQLRPRKPPQRNSKQQQQQQQRPPKAGQKSPKPQQDLSSYGPAAQPSSGAAIFYGAGSRTRAETSSRPQPRRVQHNPVSSAAEKVHPSWAAAQLQKAKLSAISVTKTASASKKIVFSDD